MPVVILAGGLATRLLPLTETVPKALIEINGQPFLWHQLELLKRSGIHRVVLLVLTCYHDDADHCECRKPRPGLIKRAAQQHGIDLSHSFLIGDRWRDVDAGKNAGCKTILIDRGYTERAPAFAPDVCVESLSGAVDWILKTTTESA
jgi:histidinol phosphatase-like enzyme